jgi:hypothetical protein
VNDPQTWTTSTRDGSDVSVRFDGEQPCPFALRVLGKGAVVVRASREDLESIRDDLNRALAAHDEAGR